MAKRPLLLTGDRVGLAAMTADDQPRFRAWLAEQPELRQAIDIPDAPTAEQQAAWFRLNTEGDRRVFSLIALPEETLIGNGGFVAIDTVSKTAEFRITIGHPDYRGKGYGTEASRLLLSYGFSTLGVDTVRLRVLPANEAALKMYRKVGFTVAGEDPEKGGLRLTMSRDQFAALHP
jgi:diamine N-acetyltransferase